MADGDLDATGDEDLPAGADRPDGADRPEGAGFDWRRVDPLDWAILAGVVLVFAFSFVSYYTAQYTSRYRPLCAEPRLPLDVEELCHGATASAWHGVFGWLGVLLAVIAGVATAAAIALPPQDIPLPPRPLALGASVLAVVSTLLALFSVPVDDATRQALEANGLKVSDVLDLGHGFGYWVVLALGVAIAALCALRFVQTGGRLRWARAGESAVPAGDGAPPAGEDAPPG